MAAALLFIAGASLGVCAYRTVFEAQGNPLGTLLHEFRPAVLFASGRGMIYADDLDVPSLDAFLAGDADIFEPDALPYRVSGTHLLANYSNSFPLTHWLLIYSVGWCWRIFGVSHEALRFLCAFFYGFSALALYCIFRLNFGRALSVMGTLFVLFLPPFLAIAPMLRDFSKAPFILFFIAIAGNMLKRRAPAAHLLKYGLALGLLVGIGYGFRQDMLICLPVALFVILVAPLQVGYRALQRLYALMAMSCAFVVLASPTLIGVRADSGSVFTHTLFQGLSRHTEQQMGFGDASYELLLRSDDTEVHTVVNAHARKRGITEKMDLYLSPAYGHAGRNLFLEWARTFPADLFARGLAAIEATTRLSSLAAEYHAYAPIAAARWSQQLAPYYTVYHRYVERFGLLFLCVALLIVSLRDRRPAIATMMVMAWFMAYPNLLFEVRHAFYLAFVTPYAALFLTASAGRSAFASLRNSRTSSDVSRLTPHASRLTSCLLFPALAAAVMGLLLALRIIQNNNMAALMAAYQQAPLERVETVVEFEEFYALVRPEKPLPGLRESWNLPVGDVATEYLALEFAPHEYPISITLAYQAGRGADFTRQLLVPATPKEAGRALYFAPVYEMANYMPIEFSLLKHRFSNTPLVNLLSHKWGTNCFLGIRLHQEDAPLLVGVYRVPDHATFPWLLYSWTTQAGSPRYNYKRTRLEKELYAVPVELRLLLTGDTEKAVVDYFNLLNRFPGHKRFARRILTLIEEVADIEARAVALFRLGRHAPDQAGLVALDIANIGDILRERNALESAEDKYRKALMLAPHDRWHQVRLADVLLARDNAAAALENYEAVLRAAPESPYAAAKFDAVCLMQADADRALQFWRELCEAHPDTAVPALRLGRELERRRNFEEALLLYQRVAARYPDNTEAILYHGILVALLEGYAKGREIMDRAISANPDIRPEFLAGLTRIAENYMETGAPAFAEAIYREVMELAPGDGWHQVHYAEALLAQENYDMAADVFVDILERDPESPYSAHTLDEIYERIAAPQQRIETWISLYELHPEAFIPGLHLGKALENAGDHAGALTQYRALYELHPEQPEAALRLGASIARLEDYATGRILMDNAIEEATHLESLFVMILSETAAYYAAAGRLAQAEVLYRELLERAPAELWHQVRLADILTLQLRYEEALDLYRSVILTAPESPYSAAQMNAIYAAQQDEAGRIAAWRDLCAALPESIIPHLHLGMAYEYAGQLEDAADVYAAALRRNPATAALQLRYGVLVALMEEYDRGRALMDAALAAAPERIQDMADGMARIATQKKKDGQYQLAESLYREAMALAPEDYWYQVHCGELLLELERHEEARELFIDVLMARPESPHTAALFDRACAAKDKERLDFWREIVGRHPDAATPHYHLGLAFESGSRREEAIDAYIAAVRIKPDYSEAQDAINRLLEVEE